MRQTSTAGRPIECPAVLVGTKLEGFALVVFKGRGTAHLFVREVVAGTE
jgi:hypothetical protein